jgi:hypothetical protein
MNNADQLFIDIADALGPDFIMLAPPGEERFIGAEVAIGIGVAIAHAVGSGILSGINDAVHDSTVNILDGAAKRIRGLLSPVRLETLATAQPDASGSDLAANDAERTIDEATAALHSGDVNARSLADLPSICGEAVKESLRAAGLDLAPASEVGVKVTVQVERMMPA